MEPVGALVDQPKWWSMYDPHLPGPQPALQTPEISALLKLTLESIDFVLNKCPEVIRKTFWFLASPSNQPCPAKDLATGDFEELNRVGMMRFLLDKVAKEDPENLKPLIRFRIGPIPMMLPLKPEIALEVLRCDQMERKFAYKLLIEFFGQGIFTSAKHDRWKEQHDLLVKLFAQRKIKEIAPFMYKNLLDAAKKACVEADGEPVDLVSLLSRMALIAFCKVYLNVDVSDIADEVGPSIYHSLAYINGALSPVVIPFGEAYHTFVRERDKVYEWIRRLLRRVDLTVLQERAADNVLVDKLFELKDLGKRDEQIEVVIASVLSGEGSSRLMLGALYGLLCNPHYIEEIRQEVECFAEEKKNWQHEYHNRKKLRCLNSIVDEALRLFPPVWLIARTPSKDVIIEGHTIPKGTEVLISTLILNRLKGNWEEDAEGFNPKRFDDLSAEQRKKFFPFAAGPMRCPGNFFAQMQTSLAISLLTHFDIELVNKGQVPEPTSAGTFRLFRELPVYLKLREKSGTKSA